MNGTNSYYMNRMGQDRPGHTKNGKTLLKKNKRKPFEHRHMYLLLLFVFFPLFVKNHFLIICVEDTLSLYPCSQQNIIENMKIMFHQFRYFLFLWIRYTFFHYMYPDSHRILQILWKLPKNIVWLKLSQGKNNKYTNWKFICQIWIPRRDIVCLMLRMW